MTLNKSIHDDGFTRVMELMHPQLKREIEKVSSPDEITIDEEKNLSIKNSNGHNRSEVVVTKTHIDYTLNKLERFRDDGRTGIEGTLHRISVIRDRYGSITGLTVRIGRPVVGVADVLTEYIQANNGMLIIGPPGVGKTTLQRDIVRIAASMFGPSVVVIDTSNELGGDGRIAHPVIDPARRIQVPSTDRQAEMIRQGLANHGPSLIVVDEIGYHGDVAVIETTGRRGVRVIATCHGETLMDVLNNPMFWPLLGHFQTLSDGSRQRIGKAVFGVAVEVHGKGKMVVHPDLSYSIDCMLTGNEIENLEYIGFQ